MISMQFIVYLSLFICLGRIYTARVKRPWKGKRDLKLRLGAFNVTTGETVYLKGIEKVDYWLKLCAIKGRLFKVDDKKCEIYTPETNR